MNTINEKGLYLIKGLFFQIKNFSGISFDSQIGGGEIIQQEGVVPCIFIGTINFDQNDGSIIDQFGSSEIKVTKVTETGFSFKKIYEGRREEIIYTLVGDNLDDSYKGIWTFNCRDYADGGFCHCSLEEIKKEEFYNPMRVIKFLSLNREEFSKNRQWVYPTEDLENKDNNEDNLPF